MTFKSRSNDANLQASTAADLTGKCRLDVVQGGEGGAGGRRGRVVAADRRHQRVEQRRRVGKSGCERRSGGLNEDMSRFTLKERILLT